MFWLLRGFKLIQQPGIRRFVYIPLLVNIILFFILYTIAGHYWHDLVMYTNRHLPHWLHWLSWLLWLIFILLALLVLAFCFGMVAILIGSPFYGLLSAKVQKRLNGPDLPYGNWHDAITLMPGMIMRQLKIILAYIIPAIILLFLSWIPVIHIIATVLWFLLGARLQVFQTLDIVFENNQASFDTLKSFYKQQRLHAMGFGSSMMLLMMIPVVNWFVLPAAVCGATAWYCDKMRVE